MAEGKRSFVLYTDYITTFEELSEEEAGRLAKHIFRYVNDQNPEPPDRITRIAFEPIKQQLKRDLRGWELSKETKSAGGQLGNLKRWHPDLYEKVMEGLVTLAAAVAIARDRRASDTVAMRSVPKNEDPTLDEKPKASRSVFKPPTLEEVTAYFNERKNGIDPAAFIAFYESKGWMIGKNKMKNWKSAVVTWEQRRASSPSGSIVKPTHANSGDGSDWDAEAQRINGR